MKRYEFFDHTADIGIHILGHSREDLFENAGFALFDIITDIAMVREQEQRTVTVNRDTPEELLVEWMGKLLFIHATQLLLFSRFHILELDEHHLTAELWGEQFKDNIHHIKTEVKAATYHNLRIYQEKDLWHATVVLDI
jgi:SHS2 domain-containing protein